MSLFKIVNSQGFTMNDIEVQNVPPFGVDCINEDTSDARSITIYDQDRDNAVVGTATAAMIGWDGDPLWWDDMYDQYLANLEKDQTPPSTNKEPYHG